MAGSSMKEYSYNKQQKRKKKNNVPLCGILLASVIFVWLSTIARDFCREFIDVSNKHLPIFIFMNFIIFALCFLSSQEQFKPSYVAYTYNVGSHRKSCPKDVESLPDEEHSEEIFEDKHIILVEDITGGEIAAVGSDNSESFERNHHDDQSEFRRLETRMSQELVITMTEPAWISMDDLSDEEFRFAIEAFIAERNEVMMQENVRDLESMHFLISTSN